MASYSVTSCTFTFFKPKIAGKISFHYMAYAHPHCVGHPRGRPGGVQGRPSQSHRLHSLSEGPKSVRDVHAPKCTKTHICHITTPTKATRPRMVDLLMGLIHHLGLPQPRITGRTQLLRSLLWRLQQPIPWDSPSSK